MPWGRDGNSNPGCEKPDNLYADICFSTCIFIQQLSLPLASQLNPCTQYIMNLMLLYLSSRLSGCIFMQSFSLTISFCIIIPNPFTKGCIMTSLLCIAACRIRLSLLSCTRFRLLLTAFAGVWFMPLIYSAVVMNRLPSSVLEEHVPLFI